jgi:ABC-2 type transport system ATP-binding protein
VSLENPPALCIEDVSHAYGAIKALRDVSFSVAGFTVLLGLNGAGKTTLFLLIARLLGLQAGSITVFGCDVHRQPQRALRHVGFVFQEPALDPDLTVTENLRYHAALHGLSRREADRRISRELDALGVLEVTHRRVRTLSGGQRRRVEIVRAVLPEPLLLLLDEPTAGLDVAGRDILLARTRAFCRERGRGVLWTTHLFDEVGENDAVVVLHRGCVVASGSRANLCDPGQDLRERFAELTGLGKKAI